MGAGFRRNCARSELVLAALSGSQIAQLEICGNARKAARLGFVPSRRRDFKSAATAGQAGDGSVGPMDRKRALHQRELQDARPSRRIYQAEFVATKNKKATRQRQEKKGRCSEKQALRQEVLHRIWMHANEHIAADWYAALHGCRTGIGIALEGHGIHDLRQVMDGVDTSL